MKHFFTLLIIIMFSEAAFSQVVMLAETFPTNRFNSTNLEGQSGSYNGMLTHWSLKSSNDAIIEADDAPGDTTMSPGFAVIGNGNNTQGSDSVFINNPDHLQTGVYILQMTNGGETMSIKFNIAR